jgi:ATP-binding protein involved in chromosome partitioning
MSSREVTDPRPGVVSDRLRDVGYVIAVSGSKGGVGKSVISALLAQVRADCGQRVGLLDLDFTSPSAHVILGTPLRQPDETFGIDPVESHGVHLMSVALLTGDRPTVLRGGDAGNALLELLAITRWGDLDVLIIDMPPGLGDAVLDVIGFVSRAEFLLVAAESRLVTSSVQRALALLTEQQVPTRGVVENLSRSRSGAVERLADDYGVPYVGAVPFDDELESALGDVAALRTTVAYGAVADLAL